MTPHEQLLLKIRGPEDYELWDRIASKLKVEDLEQLTMPVLEKKAGRGYAPKDIALLFIWLTTSHVPFFEMQFVYAPDEPDEFTLSGLDGWAAMNQKTYTHPKTGKTIELLREKFYFYFTGTPLVRQLIEDRRQTECEQCGLAPCLGPKCPKSGLIPDLVCDALGIPRGTPWARRK